MKVIVVREREENDGDNSEVIAVLEVKEGRSCEQALRCWADFVGVKYRDYEWEDFTVQQEGLYTLPDSE